MRRRRILGTVPAAAASIALPDAGRAQTSTVRRIGVLSVAPADSGFGRLVRAGLAEALRAEGYEEGRNLAVDWRFGDGRVDELPVMAAELVRGRPEVIVAVLNYEIAAAIRAASAIPIVMFLASLPVELGFVASLARPGGNVTGTTYTDPEMAGKLLQLVKELQPSAGRVANLVNYAYPGMRAYRAHFERAARALELQVIDVEAGRAEDLGPALARAAAVRPDVLFFAQDPVLASRIPEIVAAAREHRWPTMGSALQFVVEGGLMAYAPEGAHLVRRAASQVARILAGQRAAEIPVELPSIYRLMVNLRTAREIGFAVPRSLVARADQVIE